MQAVILPSLRIEYIRNNGGGYFFNFVILPLGYSVKYTDYAYIDPSYRQRATTLNHTAIFSISESSDMWVFDIGFINRIVKFNQSRKKGLDIKLLYGVSVASMRPYSPFGNIVSTQTNSMGKVWEVRVSNFPYFNIDKGKLAFMIPLKLNFSLKNNIKNKELINFELGYWHGFTHGEKYNLAYHNLTDNVVYDNVVESKGTTWQLGIQIPIKVKLKKL